MKRKRGYDSRLGKLFFFVPAIIIIILVVYAYVQLTAPGTLIVRAEDNNLAQLQVSFTVNGNSHTTPTSISLPQGSYTVTFATMQWFYPPAARNVVVTPGVTSYAVGSYQPQTKFVGVTSGGFNVTSIVVLHGVTPVIWTNPSNSTVTLNGGPLQLVSIGPGQTYSYTFSSVQTVQLSLVNTNHTLTIGVQ